MVTTVELLSLRCNELKSIQMKMSILHHQDATKGPTSTTVPHIKKKRKIQAV